MVLKALWDLFTGATARRSRERREQLKANLAKSTNKTAKEALKQLKKDKHWSDKSREELVKTGFGNLIGGATSGSLIKPSAAGEKVGQMIGTVTNKLIDLPIAPDGLKEAVDLATKGMTGKVTAGDVVSAARDVGLQKFGDMGIGKIAKDMGVSQMAQKFLRVPSAAKGGLVRRGGVVRVHNKELLVPKKRVEPLIKLMKKKGVALPLSAIRAHSIKRRK